MGQYKIVVVAAAVVIVVVVVDDAAANLMQSGSLKLAGYYLWFQ